MKRHLVHIFPLSSFVPVSVVYSCNTLEGDTPSPSPLPEVEDVCETMDNIELMRYCYDNFDVNHDGKVSFVEAKAVSEFHCRFVERSYGVDGVSLKGIEYFSGIKDLDITVKASSIKGTLDCSMFKDLRQLSIDVEAPLSVRFEKNRDLEHVFN